MSRPRHHHHQSHSSLLQRHRKGQYCYQNQQPWARVCHLQIKQMPTQSKWMRTWIRTHKQTKPGHRHHHTQPTALCYTNSPFPPFQISTFPNHHPQAPHHQMRGAGASLPSSTSSSSSSALKACTSMPVSQTLAPSGIQSRPTSFWASSASKRSSIGTLGPPGSASMPPPCLPTCGTPPAFLLGRTAASSGVRRKSRRKSEQGRKGRQYSLSQRQILRV